MQRILVLSAVLASISAFAQTSVNTQGAQSNDPCRNDVSKFEQAIGFIRQQQGVQAAAELKERLLPAKLENQILFSDGYCGLAKHLREKKLI